VYYFKEDTVSHCQMAEKVARCPYHCGLSRASSTRPGTQSGPSQKSAFSETYKIEQFLKLSSGTYYVGVLEPPSSSVLLLRFLPGPDRSLNHQS
jgi:hypothetical protein